MRRQGLAHPLWVSATVGLLLRWEETESTALRVAVEATPGPRPGGMQEAPTHLAERPRLWVAQEAMDMLWAATVEVPCPPAEGKAWPAPRGHRKR
jgi:hypothetical protein